MERLTDKRFAKEGYFELTREERDSLYIPSVEEIYRKLAEYEDLEEKGELMKVKHGKWLACGWVHGDADECQVWRCSECIIPTYNKSRYCPYCGAKMEE